MRALYQDIRQAVEWRRREGLAVGDGEGADAGFTLIELMVVLLVMAILMAIAIPTFLGVKFGAQERLLQSNLTNSIISSKALYATNGVYPVGNLTVISQLDAVEPEFTFVSGSSPGDTVWTTPNKVSVAVGTTGTVIVFSGQTPDGRCWYAEDNEESAGVLTDDGLAGVTDEPGIWYAATTPGTVWAYCNSYNIRTPLTNSANGNGGWSAAYPN